MVDHGVQFFTMRSNFAKDLMTSDLGLANAIDGDLRAFPLSAVTLLPHRAPLPISNGDRLYLRSGNSSLAKALAKGLDVRLGHQVCDIQPDGHIEYTNPSAESSFDAFDAVICTSPLPQSAALLDATTPPEWNVSFAPNLTVVLEYDTDSIGKSALVHLHGRSTPLYGQYPPSGHMLAWTACENAKIGRKIATGKTLMVAQASDRYSAEHFDDDGELGCSTIASEQPAWVKEIAESVEDLWRLSSKGRVASFAKKWRYARIKGGSQARDISYVERPAERVYFCGDGIARRSRVEHAILNGYNAAYMVASNLNSGDLCSWPLA